MNKTNKNFHNAAASGTPKKKKKTQMQFTFNLKECNMKTQRKEFGLQQGSNSFK